MEIKVEFIKSKEWFEMLEGIRNNDKTLNSIHLDRKSIEDASVKELSLALKKNHTLTSLGADF